MTTEPLPSSALTPPAPLSHKGERGEQGNSAPPSPLCGRGGRGVRGIHLLAALALLALVGCSEKHVACHPVSGQVLYDGKPAEGVQVYLMPTSAPVVPQIPTNPHGVTKADGTFSLGTYRDNDGAPEGGYQVVLLWPKKTDSDSDDVEEREVD